MFLGKYTTDNNLFNFNIFGYKHFEYMIFMDPITFGHKLFRFPKFFTTLQNEAGSPGLSLA